MRHLHFVLKHFHGREGLGPHSRMYSKEMIVHSAEHSGTNCTLQLKSRAQQLSVRAGDLAAYCLWDSVQ